MLSFLLLIVFGDPTQPQPKPNGLPQKKLVAISLLVSWSFLVALMVLCDIVALIYELRTLSLKTPDTTIRFCSWRYCFGMQLGTLILAFLWCLGFEIYGLYELIKFSTRNGVSLRLGTPAILLFFGRMNTLVGGVLLLRYLLLRLVAVFKKDPQVSNFLEVAATLLQKDAAEKQFDKQFVLSSESGDDGLFELSDMGFDNNNNNDTLDEDVL
jgi:hypothetical protein